MWRREGEPQVPLSFSLFYCADVAQGYCSMVSCSSTFRSLIPLWQSFLASLPPPSLYFPSSAIIFPSVISSRLLLPHSAFFSLFIFHLNCWDMRSSFFFFLSKPSFFCAVGDLAEKKYRQIGFPAAWRDTKSSYNNSDVVFVQKKRIITASQS